MARHDFNPSLPQIGEDLDFKGFYAEASYEGNVLENGTGLMEIVIYDENWENRISPGHGMTLVLLHDLFIDSKKCRIMPGEYTVSSSLEHSTCMTTEEVNILGLILPLGSYVMRNDGTENATYAYVAGGNITVSENGDNTVIEGLTDIRSIFISMAPSALPTTRKTITTVQPPSKRTWNLNSTICRQHIAHPRPTYG